MSTKHPAAKRSAKVKRDPAPTPEPTAAQRKRETKARFAGAGKIVLVVIGVLAMLLSVSAVACSGLINQGAKKEPYKLTGGVAATVNGVNIKEDTVTRQIMSARTGGGYESDEAWATYLQEAGLTPATYRENVIDGFARQHLIGVAEKENGITVSQEDLDKAWKDAVAGNGGDEKSFLDMLAQIGYDKASYLETLKSSLSQQKLRDKVAPAKKIGDGELLSYVNENLGTYNDARKSSHVLFMIPEDASEEDIAKIEQKATDVLERINSGELGFEDAAKEYSEDSSAKDGGNVGWDKLTTFVTEYQDALSALDKGEVSGLVKTQYGFHIIKCTDRFEVEDKVESLDQVPTEIKDAIVSMLQSSQVSADYSAWFNEYMENSDIKIFPMPEDVPYNVDMSLAGTGEDKADEPAEDGSNDDSKDADAE